MKHDFFDMNHGFGFNLSVGAARSVLRIWRHVGLNPRSVVTQVHVDVEQLCYVAELDKVVAADFASGKRNLRAVEHKLWRRISSRICPD